MVVDNKFSHGQIVFLVCDPEQSRRLVTAIKLLPDNCILYELSTGSGLSYHYDFEISEAILFLLTTTRKLRSTFTTKFGRDAYDALFAGTGHVIQWRRRAHETDLP